jgi:hypothetical protein
MRRRGSAYIYDQSRKDKVRSLTFRPRSQLHHQHLQLYNVIVRLQLALEPQGQGLE